MKPTESCINYIKNKLWYIVNNEKKEIIKGHDENNENEDYYISQGDIMKIGVEIYIFTEIFLNNNIIKKEEKENNIYDISSLNNNKSLIFDICSQPKILNEKYYCKHIVNDLKDGKNSQKFKEIKNWIEEHKLKDSYIKNIKKYQISLYKCEKCHTFYPLRFKLSEYSEVIEFIKIENQRIKII